MIVQADSFPGKPQCSNGIQEARCQTSETAVTQRRFRLNLLDLGKALAVLCQNIIQLIINSQIDQVIR